MDKRTIEQTRQRQQLTEREFIERWRRAFWLRAQAELISVLAPAVGLMVGGVLLALILWGGTA